MVSRDVLPFFFPYFSLNSFLKYFDFSLDQDIQDRNLRSFLLWLSTSLQPQTLFSRESQIDTMYLNIHNVLLTSLVLVAQQVLVHATPCLDGVPCPCVPGKIQFCENDHYKGFWYVVLFPVHDRLVLRQCGNAWPTRSRMCTYKVFCR